MRAWLIVNPASGSVTETHSIDALAAETAIELVRTTIFPDEPLPRADDLATERIELLILFAGDGTINAAACALDGWGGRVLVLPGGTMNMLAKQLHGSADPKAIVARAAADPAPEAIPLPFVEAGPHRAFVAMIAGPPAAWAHAREAVRKGRLQAAWRAARIAWTRSFAGGVRLRGTPRDRRHRAVVAIPDPGGMEIAAIDVDGWIGAVRLGLEWLAGDWRTSPAVTIMTPDAASIEGGRAIHLLFDGESVKLPGPLRVSHGMTRLGFIRTIGSEDEQ
ncbi:diacylglycerol/lipid kinase family protein [Rhizorhabdus dicambivorans]|nr:diacylglycerol kinase family protein [Rhizorhabdus dicambivorans]